LRDVWRFDFGELRVSPGNIGMPFKCAANAQKLRAALFGLSDRELMDIGIARDEIDYVASHRSIDPRSG
jgi:hypothetical protein